MRLTYARPPPRRRSWPPCPAAGGQDHDRRPGPPATAAATSCSMCTSRPRVWRLAAPAMTPLACRYQPLLAAAVPGVAAASRWSDVAATATGWCWKARAAPGGPNSGRRSRSMWPQSGQCGCCVRTTSRLPGISSPSSNPSRTMRTSRWSSPTWTACPGGARAAGRGAADARRAGLGGRNGRCRDAVTAGRHAGAAVLHPHRHRARLAPPDRRPRGTGAIPASRSDPRRRRATGPRRHATTGQAAVAGQCQAATQGARRDRAPGNGPD